MTERLLTKRNLISFGLFTIFFHAIVSLMGWFVETAWLYNVDYCMLGIMGFASILFIARKKIPIRFQPAQVLLLLFLLWYIFACLSMTITYHVDWVDHNSFGMLNTAITVFLAFPLGYIMIRDEKKNPVGKILLYILLLCWTVFITIVLINIFQGKEMITPNHGVIRMGNGSLQLNCSRNTTGSWELLFFMGCCFMAFTDKKLPLKVLFGISAIIHYIALSLSNSRGSFLAILVGFMALVAIAFYLRLSHQSTIKRLLISLFAALIAGVIFYFLSRLVFMLYNACTNSKSSSRGIVVAKEQTFSGREDIWRCALEGLVTSVRCFVFGVTPASTIDLISQMSGGKINNMYTHNQFLEIAVGIGVPGLCIFLGWFFLIIRDSYKLFFVRKNNSYFMVVPVIIFVLMLANMMEAYLVFYHHISSLAFFLLCGMLYGKVNDPVRTVPLSRQAIRNQKRRKKR